LGYLTFPEGDDVDYPGWLDNHFRIAWIIKPDRPRHLHPIPTQIEEIVMKARLNPYAAAPETMKLVAAIEPQIVASGIDPALIELVKTRASQINGCAFCIHMHTKDARAHGETEERLYLLNAWRESSLYTDKERAALAWTEALTLISETQAPDDVYEELRKHFNEAETVNLTALIGVINTWNRIAIGVRLQHPKAKTA
jgi:AhpD family alkylhydroperoxidase